VFEEAFDTLGTMLDWGYSAIGVVSLVWYLAIVVVVRIAQEIFIMWFLMRMCYNALQDLLLPET